MSEQQIAPTTPWWKNKKIILRAVLSAVLAVLLILFISTAYIFRWPGTGFTSSQKTTTATEETKSNVKKVTTTIEDQPVKTLWDWLQLVGIPVVLAVGTLIFTTRQTRIGEANRKLQHDTEMQIAENQQQEELLRTYFDRISELLLNNPSINPNIQSIVRARTLAALHILNTERKAIVLRFLHDVDLLQYVKRFLYSFDLNHTDLHRIDLSAADLGGANLEGADLGGANLRDANLGSANLEGADLRDANLRDAFLGDANLHDANLRQADLHQANLSGANLRDSNLRGAGVTPEQLKKAKNITQEQLAQLWIIKLSRPVATQEATTAQTSTTPDPSERKPEQTNQAEAEQQDHAQPKQNTDAAH